MRPYRDVYHALNRSLSGLTLDNYIKSGWQNFYTARAEDERRLDDFNDGLNALERNAQDAITRQLILGHLQQGNHHQWLAILLVRHSQNTELTAMCAGYLAQRLNSNHDISRLISEFVILEWADHAPYKFSEHLRRINMKGSACYRSRDTVLREMTDLYDMAVARIEDYLQNHCLF